MLVQVVGACRLHVCVDVTCSPFGIQTVRELAAGSMLSTCEFETRKQLVAPESKIAHSLMFLSLMSTVASSFVVAFAC